MAKLGGGASALGVVTGFAGDGQVRDAIRPIVDLGDDVFDLQDYVGRFAVRALPPKLFEQIFSNLLTLQRTLLVLDAPDLGILHLLRVEFHELEADGADWTPALQAIHPGERVADARLQRGMAASQHDDAD